MKTLTVTILIIVVMIASSCKSLEKLVDEGRYDEAIVLATKKLAGKKNKKTKHIRALEEAFQKINTHDLEYISFLKAKKDPANWAKIYAYGIEIAARQDKITPFLPLISKEGYVGSFELTDVRPILLEAGEGATEYEYQSGIDFLEQARNTGNKFLAQKAFDHFLSVGRYMSDYKDVNKLLIVTKELGTFHVLLKIEALPGWADYRAIPSFQGSRMPWTTFHTDFAQDVSFDAISTLVIEDVVISPERETVNNFIESREKEYYTDLVDANGKMVKDSLGNVIQVRQVDKYKAFITEYIRTKDARVNGLIRTTDFGKGLLLSEEFFTHDINFASDACTFRGDREALSDSLIKRVDHVLLPFPTDGEIMEEGMRAMIANFERHIRNLSFEHMYDDDLVTFK